MWDPQTDSLQINISTFTSIGANIFCIHESEISLVSGFSSDGLMNGESGSVWLDSGSLSLLEACPPVKLTIF